RALRVHPLGLLRVGQLAARHWRVHPRASASSASASTGRSPQWSYGVNPLRRATEPDTTWRVPSALRLTTTPRWVTIALKPVGAACTRSRPVCTACTMPAAISCAGTCDVAYDDVLVGTVRSSAPARTDSWLRPA